MNKLKPSYEDLEKLILEKDAEILRLRAATKVESDHRFKILSSLTSEGIMIHENGIILDANLAFANLLGYKTPEEILGKNGFETIIFTTASKAIVQEHIKHNSTEVYDIEIFNLNGTVIPVETQGSNIIFNGKPARLVSMRDITERKKVEKQLRENEQILKMVLDNFPGVLFWKDINLNYLGSNLLNAVGAGFSSADEMVGKSDYDMPWAATDADSYRAADREVLESGEPKMHMIEQIHQANNQVKWLDTSKIPLRDLNGSVVGILGVSVDITERKQLEIELISAKEYAEQSANLLRNIADNIPAYIATVDIATLKYKFVNKKFSQSFNKKTKEIVGSHIADIIGVTNAEFAMPFINEVKQGKTASYVNTFKLAEGQRFINVNYVPSYNEFGKLTEIIVLSQDITDLKEAEIAIQQSKEKAEESELQFRNLFELAADAIFIAEVESRKIVHANQAAEKLMQMPYSKLIGMHQSLLHPIDNEGYTNDTFSLHLEQSKKPTLPNLIENIIVRSDGKLIPVEILASQVFYKGQLCLMGTFRDITERKKSEFELLVAKELAEANNANVTAIIEGTNDSIWAFNRNFEILYINRTFQNEFYQTFGVFLESGVSLINSLPEALQPLWKPRYNRVLANEQFTVEDAIDTGNGMIYIQVTFNPIVKKGEVIGGSCFGSNITSRRLAEIELLNAKEQAEESDRLKTAFLQNMSHEIRTPMNAIMGFSSLLVENYGNKPKLEKYSEIIFQRCTDLLDIINDILDISKIESGQLAVNIDKCNIIELFTELESFFTEHKKRLGKQHLIFKLQCLCNPSCTSILTDKVKLNQILINLINNAFKFTEKGTIECGCKQVNNQLVFHVSDTGIGIPVDKQNKIFERFSQLHNTSLRNSGGTGLGLSIAKGLTNLLGGEMWLESEPNKGSTFYFSIQYNKAEDGNRSIGIETKSLNFCAQSKTILIVEDDIFNLEYLKEILANSGYSIISTENGNEAIKIAESQAVDLILIDVRLPDITGYEATHIIKQSKPNIKIIAQTAYAAQDECQKALDAGCIDYISKPTKRELLLKLLSKHLSQQ